MNENDTPRAEQVIPPGFRPLQFPQVAPPVVDLDKQTGSDDEPMIVAQGDLRDTAEALGSMRVLAALLEDGPRAGVARQLGDMARFWQRHVRLIGGMAAVVALALVGAVLPVGGTASAQAAEAPQPDPIAVVAQPTASVVLDRARATVRLRVTTPYATRAGYHCASAWSQVLVPAFVGRACSLSPTFTVTATLDAAALPLGVSRIAVTDDVQPLWTTPATVTVTVRRPSKFGIGVWNSTQYGDGLVVAAPLAAYSPAAGRWLPQQGAAVRVQELRAGRWVTVGSGRTNRYGTALVTVILGGGVHTVRVTHPATGATTATNGSAHTFDLGPTDVPDGVI